MNLTDFPLNSSEIGQWLAITAIILLITSELILSSPEISTRIRVDRKRLRYIAIGCGLTFLATVVYRVIRPF